jgi:hypothetical protein
MNFGEQICMLGCGASFIGGSVLVASFVLRFEEIQAVWKNRVLQIFLLSLISMGLLVCTNVLFLSGLFWIWLMGSVFGGMVTLEVAWNIRRRWTLKRYA